MLFVAASGVKEGGGGGQDGEDVRMRVAEERPREEEKEGDVCVRYPTSIDRGYGPKGTGAASTTLQ